MAVISGTSLALGIHINTMLLNSFVPRSNAWVWNRFCGNVESNTANEPFAIPGAAPAFEAWRNFTNYRPVPSFKMNVPNTLFKAGGEISRLDVERDQSAGFWTSWPSQFGLNLANHFDYFTAQYTMISWMNGSQNPSFQGETGSNTIDGQPMFSENHVALGQVQSNIIHGGLPQSRQDVLAAGFDSVANTLINDSMIWEDVAKTLLNTNGTPVHPGYDLAAHAVLIFPPHLGQAARTAFRSTLIDATTSPGALVARDVIVNGLYANTWDSLFGTGQTFSMPNVSAPAAPTTGTVAGGTNTGATYYVVTNWVTPYGTSQASPVSTQAVATDYLLTVTQSNTSAGRYSGFNVYVGTSATGPFYLQNSLPIALGSTWTEPASGIITTGTTVPAGVPNLENAYWVFLINDYVWPAYVQLFNSLGKNQTFPSGQNDADMVERLVGEYGLSPVQARTVGNAMIETSFGLQGNLAIPEVMNQEKFTIAGRLWSAFLWGPWFNAFMVVPSSAPNPLIPITMPFNFATAA